MQTKFYRSPFTWVTYTLLSFYGYFLNILGPITPFLQDDLHISYTISSLHYTFFAAGMLVTGLTGDFLIRRAGRVRSLWIGAIGMSLAAILLVVGRHPVVTIGATFLMGCIGTLILVIVPSALSDEHREKSPVAIAEANTISSLVNALAPLLVGWFAYTFFGWRLAIVLGSLSLIVLFIFLRKATPPVTEQNGQKATAERLPFLYWVYWVAMVLGVSVEFCMIFWSANYFEVVLGLDKASAAQAVSLFLGGMIIGRFACSRLAQIISARKMVIFSIVLAAFGFAFYWLASAPWVGMLGLALCGLGVASLYPLIISLAIASSKGNTIQASTRASLASGTAILALPLLLGGVADSIGLRPAYAVVAGLLVCLMIVFLAAGRMEKSA
ncbi:MAG: MFS transporter [Anaerolineae bacterium]|nr:MFS transporter [Anaerolineae bacterium]